MYWATFNLSYHAWDEPILRAAAAEHVQVATPRVGEVVQVRERFSNVEWYKPAREQFLQLASAPFRLRWNRMIALSKRPAAKTEPRKVGNRRITPFAEVRNIGGSPFNVPVQRQRTDLYGMTLCPSPSAATTASELPVRQLSGQSLLA